jgi:hypothetical protein
MKFIKRKLRKWILEAEEDYSEGSRPVSTKESNHIDVEPVINFRIYSAQNGQILEFSKYDRVKDRSDRTVYIINKDEDLGEKVAKCLSLEMLR